MTRTHKRDVDKEALRESWKKQAAGLGFDARTLAAEAAQRETGKDAGRAAAGLSGDRQGSGKAAEADRAAAWAVAHLSEREAVFARTDLLAAMLAWRPGAVAIGEAEDAVTRLEKAGTLHAANLPVPGQSLTTDKAVADEKETVVLMNADRDRGAAVMRGRAVDKALRNGPLTASQKDAVKLILSGKDRAVGVQGYAGTGKTAMLNRARALLEKRGFEVAGLAPSASAARTLENEAGIRSETLQRFLARNAGVAEGRLTARGERQMRAAFRKTVLVVDEGSLASTVQARDLLRIANTLRIPRVVLIGDEKQLGAVKAFEKLGPNVAEVKADNLAGAAAARWLRLSPEQRENAGLMAPSHALREKINEIIRERLIRDGTIAGPTLETERLVSRGYTNAEKSLAANYAPRDVVAFHRAYKRLGVGKGDELRVVGIDRDADAVKLEGKDGGTVSWDPYRLAGRTGGVEVYRVDATELHAGDRIRWTRNDARRELVNSATAEVTAVKDGTVRFRLEDGWVLDMRKDDPQLRHIDRAWASTVHAFQGRTVDTVIAAMEANHPHLTTQKTLYVEISRARDHAELVTDDRGALRERLEAATGERVAALESIGEMAREVRDREAEVGRGGARGPDAGSGTEAGRNREGLAWPSKQPDARSVERGRNTGVDLGL